MTNQLTTAKLVLNRLLDEIKRGDNVLFLGADLPPNYPGAPLSRPELAAVLAQKYNLPLDLSWSETAQAYLSKYPPSAS